MKQEIKGFKGFDNNLKCREFTYKVGETFKEIGEIKACQKGFHFCEFPLDVFGYYPPSDSRYCIVKGSGKIDKDCDNSKVACSQIHIEAEIGLKGIINAGVKFILDKINWGDDKVTNTGDQSAATNTGDQSAATNTGDRSAATNTGDRSAATNTGDRSAATVEGRDSIAIVTGMDSKASGSLGCWLVLTERGDWDGECNPIKEVISVKVDGEIIKPNTFYKLINGKIVEVI